MKICIKVKRDNFIRIFVKDQIHIHHAALFYKIPQSVIIIPALVLRYHTVPCPSGLPGHIVHRIARAGRHTDHMGQVHILLHKIIQGSGGKDTSRSSSLQNKCCFLYIHNDDLFS